MAVGLGLSTAGSQQLKSWRNQGVLEMVGSRSACLEDAGKGVEVHDVRILVARDAPRKQSGPLWDFEGARAKGGGMCGISYGRSRYRMVRNRSERLMPG